MAKKAHIITVAMMQPNHAFVPAIIFRCLIWMMTVGLIVAGISPLDSTSSTTVFIISACSAAYTIIWSLFLPQIIHWSTRIPALLLIDVVLSALPAWVSGGWLSPFLLFMLGALIVPGALFHWLGVIGAVAGAVLIDQLIGWTTWPSSLSPAVAVPTIALGYVRMLVAATIWPLSFELWKWRTHRHADHTAQADLLENVVRYRETQPLVPRAEQTTRIEPEQAENAPTVWRATRPSAQTLEQVPVALHAAIEHVVAEAVSRGLQVRLNLPQQERALPQSHVHLLAKAVEVGLDNIQSHATTCEADIDLVVDETAPPSLVLSVRDHGNGLLDGTADLPGFHHIRCLRYRLQDIDGTLDVRDADTGGVIFVVRIPLT